MKSEEVKGQNLILVTILILILTLAYCSIPVKPGETPKKKDTYRKWILRSELVNGKLPAPEKPSPADLKESVEETAHQAVEKTEPVPQHQEPSPKAAAEPEQQKTAAQETASGSQGILLMNTPSYASHTKPIVVFDHQKHKDTYSKGCGDCHHDDKGKPLDLKPEDSVASCIECHKETQKVKGEKLEEAEKIMKYHQEALHANCIGCHKAYNIEKGDPKGKGPAPASCTQCHKKS